MRYRCGIFLIDLINIKYIIAVNYTLFITDYTYKIRYLIL